MKYLLYHLTPDDIEAENVILPWNDSAVPLLSLPHQVTEIEKVFLRSEVIATSTPDFQKALRDSYQTLMVRILSVLQQPEWMTRLVLFRDHPKATRLYRPKEDGQESDLFGWTISAGAQVVGLDLPIGRPPVIGRTPTGFSRGETFPWRVFQNRTIRGLDLMPRDWETDSQWLQMVLDSVETTFEFPVD